MLHNLRYTSLNSTFLVIAHMTIQNHVTHSEVIILTSFLALRGVVNGKSTGFEGKDLILNENCIH